MRKSIGILLYLVLMSIFLKFDLRLLFDLRQLLLVIFGTLLLLLPSLYERGSKDGRWQELPDNGRYRRISKVKCYFREERLRIGQNAVWAGILQTFVLLFVNMNVVGRELGGMQTIARSCRPILYGFCLWIILQDSEKKKEQAVIAGSQGDRGKNDKTAGQIQQQAVDYRECLQGLGLTRREVEIALLVIKKESNAEIADRLFISETTVKKHISNIFSKLEIGQRQEIREKCIAFLQEDSEENKD